MVLRLVLQNLLEIVLNYDFVEVLPSVASSLLSLRANLAMLKL